MTVYTWTKNNRDSASRFQFASGTIIVLNGWADLNATELAIMQARDNVLVLGQQGQAPPPYDPTQDVITADELAARAPQSLLPWAGNSLPLTVVNGPHDGSLGGSGGVVGEMSRVWWPLPQGASQLAALQAGWYVSPSGNNQYADEYAFSDVTYSMSFETADGLIYQLRRNGALSWTVVAGTGFQHTDFVDVDIPVSQGGVWVRTYATFAANANYPWGRKAIAARNEGRVTYTSAPVNQTNATGPLSTTGGTYNQGIAVGPMTLVGRQATPAAPLPVVAFEGDSITMGAYDSDNTEALNDFQDGYVSRVGVALGVPFYRVGKSGEEVYDWIVDGPKTSFMRRRTMHYGATDVHLQWGGNDFRGNRTAQTTANNVLARATSLSNRNIRVSVGTVTPVNVTSSDSFATVANQTPWTNDPERVAYNNWVRDGCPIVAGAYVVAGSTAAGVIRAGNAAHPISFYYEVADAVESSRNSGRFKANGTAGFWSADGIHPNKPGHAAISALLAPQMAPNISPRRKNG